jgi:hypothetical protein
MRRRSSVTESGAAGNSLALESRWSLAIADSENRARAKTEKTGGSRHFDAGMGRRRARRAAVAWRRRRFPRLEPSRVSHAVQGNHVLGGVRSQGDNGQEAPLA